MTSPPIIAARILAADLACLGREVAASVRSGADLVHLDVMDVDTARSGDVGPRTCAALRRVTRAPIEIHLLVKPDDALLAAYAGAGADMITFHPEACEDVRQTLLGVRGRGCKVGVAVAPGEPLLDIDPLLEEVDEVLVTCASPGPDGERFAPATIRNVRTLRDRIRATGAGVTISVDGGVSAENAAELVEAGADALVVGAALCRSRDGASTIAALKGLAPGGGRGATPPRALHHLPS